MYYVKGRRPIPPRTIAKSSGSYYYRHDYYEKLPTTPGYREAIVSNAKMLLGTLSMRYESGRPEIGQSVETGFDCSGFVRHVLRTAGLHIPDFFGMDGIRRPIRHASEFWDHYGVAVAPARHLPGDLVLFSRNGLFPTHIGIMTGRSCYIHAPGSDFTEVSASELREEAIPMSANTDERLYDSNPIGFKRPVVVSPNPSYRYHQQPI